MHATCSPSETSRPAISRSGERSPTNLTASPPSVARPTTSTPTPSSTLLIASSHSGCRSRMTADLSSRISDDSPSAPAVRAAVRDEHTQPTSITNLPHPWKGGNRTRAPRRIGRRELPVYDRRRLSPTKEPVKAVETHGFAAHPRQRTSRSASKDDRRKCRQRLRRARNVATGAESSSGHPDSSEVRTSLGPGGSTSGGRAAVFADAGSTYPAISTCGRPVTTSMARLGSDVIDLLSASACSPQTAAAGFGLRQRAGFSS